MILKCLPFIIILLPIIWYSWQKNKYLLLAKKRISFALRFAFMGFYAYLFAIVSYLLFSLRITSSSYFGNYSNIMCALCTFALELIWVFVLNKYEIPFEYRNDFMDFDYYIYTPTFSESIPKFWSLPEILKAGERPPEAIINPKYLAGKDFFITNFGELLVSSKALELFRKHSLSGYYTEPVKDWYGNRIENYFSIIEKHVLPPRSKKSTLKPDSSYKRIRVSGHLFFNSSDIYDCGDFNKSAEEIGAYACYGRQHYWILSKKAVRVLIEDLGQPKSDFQPVYLINDETSES